MFYDALRKAQSERKRLSKTFDPLIEKAQKEKRYEAEQSLISEFLSERNIIDDKISSLESMRIQKEAEDLGIPVPPYKKGSEFWEEGYQPNRVFLTLKARYDLRRQIREDRRQRREDKMVWVKDLIVPLTGLLGTLIGVISAFHSCRGAK